MNLRTIALTGIASLAGFGLVGAGAHAVFTTNTYTQETISAGTAAVVTWSPDATNGCTTEAIAEEYPATCNTVTLGIGPVGSTFDSPIPVGVENNGNISVTVASLGWSQSTTFGADLGVCLNGGALGSYVYDGPLYGFTPNPYSFTGATLTPGNYATYNVEFFAGGPGSCGPYSQPALPNGDQGLSDTVTWTVDYNG